MKRILSGISPSGQLCIGNYVGALKNWVHLQDEYESIFLIVDMHAITVKQKPADLRARCLSFLAQFIACGIDPDKSLLVVQSHVPQHAELAWTLGTFTQMGELNRMTQFKDKSTRHKENINSGLYTYPVLMAADILLYQADLVPVGADQKQHLELTRNIAQRFNGLYSDTFKIPEPFIPDVGSRIMSLQDPGKKMSKSDENPNNLIALLDSTDVVIKKLKRAVTDSGSEIKFDQKLRPGLSNLISLYSALSGLKISEVENEFEGKQYSSLKTDLAELVNETLIPIQKNYQSIMADKRFLETVMLTSAEKAQSMARKTLSKVYRKIGFIPYPRN